MVIFALFFINDLQIALQVVFCAFHGICAIIISMNEEGNGATAPQVQNQAPAQPAKPTSAVNTGFDASRIGSGKSQKPKKIKKIKEKQSKEARKVNQSTQGDPRKKTKRPLWFWIVLSVLTVAVVGAIVWMAIMLASPRDQEEIPTELTVGESYEGDGDGDNSAVEKYLAQLRSISGIDNESSIGEKSGEQGLDSARKATDNAVSASSDQKQKNAIQAAELITLFQHSEYNEVVNASQQIDFDALSFKEQSLVYAAIKSSYIALGNMEEAEKYRQLEETADIKLHGGS